MDGFEFFSIHPECARLEATCTKKETSHSEPEETCPCESVKNCKIVKLHLMFSSMPLVCLTTTSVVWWHVSKSSCRACKFQKTLDVSWQDDGFLPQNGPILPQRSFPKRRTKRFWFRREFVSCFCSAFSHDNAHNFLLINLCRFHLFVFCVYHKKNTKTGWALLLSFDNFWFYGCSQTLIMIFFFFVRLNASTTSKSNHGRKGPRNCIAQAAARAK